MAGLPSSRTRGLQMHTLALVLLLVLVGMWVNLFVMIPKNHPGLSADYFAGAVGGVSWALARGPSLLQAHVALGVLIGLMAVAHLVNTVRLRVPGTLGWSIVGLAGVLGAAGNGASFLNYSHDFSSMLMSLGFAIALVGYLVPGLARGVSADGRPPAA